METSEQLSTLGKMFEGQRLTTILYKEQLWWIAREVGAVLGYGTDGKSLIDMIGREWVDDFDEADKWLVTGEDLRTIKLILGDDLAKQVGVYFTPTLLLLSESGIYKAAILSRKPEGRRLRDWLSKTVLPEVRRTGAYQGALSDPRDEVHHLQNQLIRAQAALIERLQEDVRRPRRRRPRALPVPPPAPELPPQSLRQEILGLLGKPEHQRGLKVDQVAAALGRRRQAVHQELLALITEGAVCLRQEGQAKLYHLVRGLDTGPAREPPPSSPPAAPSA